MNTLKLEKKSTQFENNVMQFFFKIHQLLLNTPTNIIIFSKTNI